MAKVDLDFVSDAAALEDALSLLRSRSSPPKGPSRYEELAAKIGIDPLKISTAGPSEVDVVGSSGRPKGGGRKRGGGGGGGHGGGSRRVGYCVFCKNNGESAEEYNKHVLKDWDGRIVCPVLYAYHCPICGSTGENAHTIRYCPLSAENLKKLKEQNLAVARRIKEGSSSPAKVRDEDAGEASDDDGDDGDDDGSDDDGMSRGKNGRGRGRNLMQNNPYANGQYHAQLHLNQVPVVASFQGYFPPPFSSYAAAQSYALQQQQAAFYHNGYGGVVAAAPPAFSQPPAAAVVRPHALSAAAPVFRPNSPAVVAGPPVQLPLPVTSAGAEGASKRPTTPPVAEAATNGAPTDGAAAPEAAGTSGVAARVAEIVNLAEAKMYAERMYQDWHLLARERPEMDTPEWHFALLQRGSIGNMVTAATKEDLFRPLSEFCTTDLNDATIAMANVVKLYMLQQVQQQPQQGLNTVATTTD